jgi:hypothetical protein
LRTREKGDVNRYEDPTPERSESAPERAAPVGGFTVGRVDDPEERAADRVADRLVESIERAAEASVPTGGSASGGRIRRSSFGGPDGGAVDGTTSDRIRRARSGGDPLPDAVRTPFEQSMRTDLGRVRMHTGTEPAALNESLGARAFTVGQDIFLRDGTPDTGSTAGQHLIAHEVAHTVQQGDAHRSGLRRIQRLPSWNTVKQRVGDPKTGKNLLTRRTLSKDYKAFGVKLTAYDNVTNVVIDANGGTRAQDYLAIVTALDDVSAAAGTYNATHTTDQRARMIAGIGAMVTPEKAILKTRKNFFDNNPPNGVQRWNQVLPTSLGTEVFQLDEGTAGGQAAGGINTVTEYGFGGGFDTYYKEAEDQLRQNTPEYAIGQDMAIPVNDPNMDKRALAAWRVDQLLGANVLTRTEIAIAAKASTHKGVISEAATGEKFGTRGNRQGDFYATRADRANDLNSRADAFTGDDPVFQRCLSKLTIVDALCGQVDRHAGNWYVQTDGAGNVLGIVGIDNDLAFPESPDRGKGVGGKGKWADVTKAYRSYPGVGIYFDWEMAETVLALDPADLAAVVADLLPQKAIAVLLRRLTSLKAEINTAKLANRLLTANQWGIYTNPKGTGVNVQPETGGYAADFI